MYFEIFYYFLFLYRLAGHILINYRKIYYNYYNKNIFQQKNPKKMKKYMIFVLILAILMMFAQATTDYALNNAKCMNACNILNNGYINCKYLSQSYICCYQSNCRSSNYVGQYCVSPVKLNC